MFVKILNVIRKFLLSIVFPEKITVTPAISTTPIILKPEPLPPPPVPPIEPKAKESKLIPFCLAIQAFEGYYPGSRSYTTRNPGNIRYVGQKLAIGQDSYGFCIFATYDDGFQALQDLVINACMGKSRVYSPDMTILSFFSKYAPTEDDNDPGNYAKFVANKIGELVTFKIKNLL